MHLEAMMTFQGIVTIALVIASVGAGVTRVFRHAHSPYLLTITGSRTELFVFGAMMWVTAVGLGLTALLLVTAVTSPIVGLAVFFGVEAVTLDICAHRTHYVRTSTPAVQHARVRVTLPFRS